MDDAALVELLAHFFYPLHAHCPACGSVECDHWQKVRELAPVARELVDAIATSGVVIR
jgi:hypothetical protein